MINQSSPWSIRYNIIGWQHKTKLVVPCPGAVHFTRLIPDLYYQIKRG
ncbi:MAG: hypothetical protein HQK55_00820 [Deltaproteobacteria bacterium]|nr:hypothetical protein [Deltaproteobacteria bacterium]